LAIFVCSKVTICPDQANQTFAMASASELVPIDGTGRNGPLAESKQANDQRNAARAEYDRWAALV
jgi:hypothetical protein